jgi:hypothetical protein
MPSGSCYRQLMTQFLLHRVDLRDRIELDYHTFNHGWLGEETRWLINVPAVFRALAAPNGTHDFIRAPQPYEEPPGGAPAYWGSLLYLLIYSFGWSSPAHGIAWWVRAGRPTDDPRFALMEQVWVRDGQFDWFCAWLWQTQPRFDPASWSASHDELLRGQSDAWFQWMLNEIQHSRTSAPYGGYPGSDPLHLAAHLGRGFEHDFAQGSTSLTLDASGGTNGVLLAEHLMAWPTHLRDSSLLADGHPSGRSWRIDVVVKTVGWLGTYRRSLDTGRWFTGPHRYHEVGNPS